MIVAYNKSQTKAPAKATPAPAKAAAKPAAKAAAKPAAKSPAKAAAKSPAKAAPKAKETPLSLTRPKRGAPEPASAPKAKKAKVEAPKAKAAAAPKAAPAPKAAAKPAAKAAAKKPVRAAAKPVKVKAVASKRIAKVAAKPAAKKPAAKPAAKKPAAKAKAAAKPAAKAKGKSSKGEVVEVDKILAMRSSSKGVEYHIQWVGGGKKGGEKSWEPEDNVMDDDLVDDFEAALQEKIYGGQSFAAGEKVEVRNVDDGFDNSWTGATVQKSKGSKFAVEYSAFVDDKGKKMTDNVDRSRLRPTQAAAAGSWTPQVGEIVEINDADCWWEARVQSIKGKSIKAMFRVSDEVKDLSLGTKVRPCAWLKMAAPAK
eukprot:scaffold41220_cov71-Phaeocystis_antarctica.AAC.20